DIGTADPGTGEEIPYLVMEFVGGRALDQIIADGPMQPRQAAEIMVQVARALAAAHTAGVVHRDLKPSNIMIADDDHAKVLDFGLARLIRAAGHVPEATLTAPGMVLGSCPYMAPEQALGRGVSETGDLFSLGVVLYEVLCGRRAFTGSTPVQVLQAVIRCDYPKIEDTCPSVPSALEAIVERCLEKEPSNRYGNADMVVQDLEAFLQRAESLDIDGPTVEIKTSSIRAVSDRRRRRAIRRVMVGGLVLSIGGLTGFLGGRVGTEELRPAPGNWRAHELLDVAGTFHQITWNPQGTALMTEVERGGDTEVLVVPVDGSPPWSLVGTTEEGTPGWPVFSPDGKAVAFTRVGGDRMVLEVVPAVGGAPVGILENAAHGRWLDEKRLVFSRLEDGVSSLSTWAPDSGRVELFRHADADRWWWEALPRPGGGFALLGGGSDTRAGIFVTPEPDGPVEQWAPEGRHLQGVTWHPEGRSLLVSFNQDLLRISQSEIESLLPKRLVFHHPAFDATGERLAVATQDETYDLLAVDPETGEVDCQRCGRRDLGWGSVGSDGTIVFRRTGRGRPSLVMTDPDGGEDREMTSAGAKAASPAFSPDGRRIAFLKSGEESGVELRVISRSGGEAITLATGVEGSEFPSWSPDGRFVAFGAGSPLQVWVVSSAGGEKRAVSPPGGDYPVWSPDGKRIAYTVWTDASDENQGTWIVPAEGGTAQKISDSPTRVAWSPDGSRMYQLQREHDELVINRATVGSWQWSRQAVVDLADPPPPHFEYLPLTVEPKTGRLILNHRNSRSTLVVFEGLDPDRW
ncbi:MAG: protein kinase, partial [Thermoanaerobaculales bacterium]|nr:protein kinase [Thermoanaerobaculales bacterium]